MNKKMFAKLGKVVAGAALIMAPLMGIAKDAPKAPKFEIVPTTGAHAIFDDALTAAEAKYPNCVIINVNNEYRGIKVPEDCKDINAFISAKLNEEAIKKAKKSEVQKPAPVKTSLGNTQELPTIKIPENLKTPNKNTPHFKIGE